MDEDARAVQEQSAHRQPLRNQARVEGEIVKQLFQLTACGTAQCAVDWVVGYSNLERLQRASVDDGVNERVVLLMERHTHADVPRLGRLSLGIQLVNCHDPFPIQSKS